MSVSSDLGKFDMPLANPRMLSAARLSTVIDSRFRGFFKVESQDGTLTSPDDSSSEEDRWKTGFVLKEDFQTMLGSLGWQVEDWKYHTVFDFVDVDGDGKISYREWKEFVQDAGSFACRTEFRRATVDGRTVTKDKFFDLLAQAGENQDVEAKFNNVDLDHDNSLTYEEFHTWYQKSSLAPLRCTFKGLELSVEDPDFASWVSDQFHWWDEDHKGYLSLPEIDSFRQYLLEDQGSAPQSEPLITHTDGVEGLRVCNFMQWLLEWNAETPGEDNGSDARLSLPSTMQESDDCDEGQSRPATPEIQTAECDGAFAANCDDEGGSVALSSPPVRVDGKVHQEDSAKHAKSWGLPLHISDAEEVQMNEPLCDNGSEARLSAPACCPSTMQGSDDCDEGQSRPATPEIQTAESDGAFAANCDDEGGSVAQSSPPVHVDGKVQEEDSAKHAKWWGLPLPTSDAEEVQKNKPLCDKGHRLSETTLGFFKGRVHERQCDRCQSMIPRSAPRFSCTTGCDFDVCSDCYH